MTEDSTKRSRRQYRRRSPREILIGKKDELKSSLEKRRQRLDEDEKGLQQVESEIEELDRKARNETRDQQEPLIGLVIMHRMREDPKRRSQVAQLLDELLNTPADRAVFGLDPLTREERKQRSGLEKDDVEPFTVEELRAARSASQPETCLTKDDVEPGTVEELPEVRSASQRRSRPNGSSGGSDAQADRKP